MSITVTPFHWTARGAWAARYRGWLPAHRAADLLPKSKRRLGEPLAEIAIDTKLLIPEEVFAASGRDARKKGDGYKPHARTQQIADFVATWAALEATRWNDPTSQRAAKPAAETSTPREMTFAELWEHYRERNPDQVKASTLDRSRKYAKAIIQFFDFTVPTPPSRVTLGKAELFRNWRLTNGLSPATVFRELVFLKGIIAYAVARQDETRVLSTGLTSIPRVIGKKGRRQKLALTAEQIVQLLLVTHKLPRRGRQLREIIFAGVGMRLRKTPLLGLSGEWMNGDRSWLHVPAEFNKGRGENYHPISVPIPASVARRFTAAPTRGLVWPSTFRRRLRSDVEVEAAASAASAAGKFSVRDELIIALARRYRIRAGAIVSLRWESDVDLETRILRGVNTALGADHVVLGDQDVARFEVLQSGRGKSEFVFATSKGTKLSHRTVFHVVARAERISGAAAAHRGQALTTLDRSLAKACALAGVPRITLHDLRRTGNTLLITHRCAQHVAAVEEVVRERLMEHVPTALKAAYDFIDDDTLHDAVTAYDCIFAEYERRCGVVDIASRRTKAQ